MCKQCHLDDLSEDLTGALVDCHDAAWALTAASNALHSLDPIEARAKLVSAVDQLREALKAAEAALEPMGHLADRASGDW